MNILDHRGQSYIQKMSVKWNSTSKRQAPMPPVEENLQQRGKLPVKYYIQTPQGPLLLQSRPSHHAQGIQYGRPLMGHRDNHAQTNVRKQDYKFPPEGSQITNSNGIILKRRASDGLKSPLQVKSGQNGVKVMTSSIQPIHTRRHIVNNNNNNYIPAGNSAVYARKDVYPETKIKLFQPVFVKTKHDQNRNYKVKDSSVIILNGSNKRYYQYHTTITL